MRFLLSESPCPGLDRRQFLKETALAAAGCISAARFPAEAGDESSHPIPGWTSFRNGLNNLGIAAEPLVEKLSLLWSVTTQDGTVSTPVISQGRVYMATLSGDLLCLDLMTGREIWKYKSVEQVEPNNFPPGFNAPAALDAQSIFIGDDVGTMHAVDRHTGRKSWSVETGAEIVGGAQVTGRQVIFGSHDGYLYCHDVNSGSEIWKVETHGPVNGTPCLAGKFTFTTGCDKPILRVIDIEAGKQAAEVPIDARLIASAAVREGILYFGTDVGSVVALDWEQQKIVWTFAIPGHDQQIHSSPAVTDEVVVIGSRDKNVTCLDRRSGDQRWSFPTRSKVDCSPVIVGDHVYFGSGDKNLYAVNLADGREVWKEPVGQSITGSPAVAEGRLVIGTDPTKGKILCFGPG